MSLYQEEKEHLELQVYQNEAQLRAQFDNYKHHGIFRSIPVSLVIGGALFLLYIASRKVFKKKNPEHSQQYSTDQLQRINEPKHQSFIVRKIKEYIAVFVLSMLRDKLHAYIREQSRNEPIHSINREKE